MANYYYSKYEADETYSYSNPSSFVYLGRSAGQVQGYTGYAWSSSTGYTSTGSLSSAQSIFLYGFTANPPNTICGRYFNDVDNSYLQWQASCDSSVNYSQGDLLQAGIIAPDGTYPDDDEQDGFWWVKGALADSGMNFLALF